jgi:hypothetical protein
VCCIACLHIFFILMVCFRISLRVEIIWIYLVSVWTQFEKKKEFQKAFKPLCPFFPASLAILLSFFPHRAHLDLFPISWPAAHLAEATGPVRAAQRRHWPRVNWTRSRLFFRYMKLSPPPFQLILSFAHLIQFGDRIKFVSVSSTR